MKLNFAESKLK